MRSTSSRTPDSDPALPSPRVTTTCSRWHKTQDGATVTIELHHELLVRTPFVEPRDFDAVIGRSQSFDWGGLSYQTLGCEDMLWHVYAHAFVINTLRPGAIRLLSVADLVHATEAWVDRIDWARLRREYGRLLRALHVLHDLVPWSPQVAAVLREQVSRPAIGVRAYPIDSDPEWSVGLMPGCALAAGVVVPDAVRDHRVASLAVVSFCRPCCPARALRGAGRHGAPRRAFANEDQLIRT